MTAETSTGHDDVSSDEPTTVSSETVSVEDGGAADVTFSADDVEDLVELLTDGYTRRILRTIGDQELSAREIVERCDMSRATVYRRLNELKEHDMVASHIAFHPDGHHRKVFAVTLETVAFEMMEDAPVVRIEVDDDGDGDDATSVPDRAR